ncbi:MAG: flagellar motor switch phosphatase FliY [Lachnospiraceae bacterium]|nr:flagellar motor switch phosphatase FliY [Lachnospiraceae bacterium]
MDGMLSQDEINALLSGMDLSGESAPDLSELADLSTPTTEDTLGSAYLSGAAPVTGGDELLTDVEKDAIGEVANISMGSSATTMYSLVNHKVNITTPIVELAQWDSILSAYEKPCVFIQIKYTKGLDGTNILVLKEQDVKIITDLMMGGDGTNTAGELGELHLSAISEAMNQMMGSAATSLSTMLQTMIDISPPDSTLLDLAKYKTGADIAPFLGGTFVKISFRMQIGDLVDSTIMQLYPVDFARKLVETFINTQTVAIEESIPEATPVSQTPAPEPVQAPEMNAAPNMGSADMGMNPQMFMSPQMGMDSQMSGMGSYAPGMDMNMGMNPQMFMNPMMGMNPQMFMNPTMGMNPMMGGMQNGAAGVNVQPAQFQNFSGNMGGIQGQENIGLIMDVPLEVTVELGRTSKSISEILNFAPGTIIELERIAGEPIDVLVNGKFVAKGEVVVIEESFGVRVTEIIK